MRLEFETKATAFPLVENRVFEDDGFAEFGNFESLLKKGISAAQSGDRDHARQLLSQATAVNPQSEDAWMWLASISEYPEELLAFLNRVLEINPENDRAAEWLSATNSLLAKTFVQRAIAAYEENALDRVAQSLDQALSYDNECELAWLWKAKLAQSDDQKLELLDHILIINPENPDAIAAIAEIKRTRSQSAFNEAKAAAAAGDRTKAVEILDAFVKEAPDSVQALLLKSHLSVGLESKIEALESALAIDPENEAAKSGLAFLTLTFGSTNRDEEPETYQTVKAAEDEGSSEPAGEQPSPVMPVENPVAAEFFTPPVAETVADEVDRNEVETDREADLEAESAYGEGDTQTVFEPETTPEEYPAGPTAEMYSEPVPEDEPAADYRFEAEEALVQSVEDMFAPDEEPLDVQHEMADSGPDHVNGTLSEEPLAVEGSDIVEEDAAVADDESFSEPRFDHVESQFVKDVPPVDSPAEDGHNDLVCPYCTSPNEVHAFECATCRATLTLADIEALLSFSQADREVVQHAVTKMEAEWNLREFTEQELTELGVGHLNLNNFESGFKYLQEASRLNPNNVMLAGNVNKLAIRLDEMRRQSENYDAMPKGKAILVVDDSPTVRKLIAGKLEKSGHSVVCAVDGIDALTKLEDCMPDLVLLDITMPRMDGYEVCKQIRSNPAGKDLPVVMISGKDGFFDKVRGRMAGTTGYITKPFGPETLMKALETYLLPENVEVS